MMPIIARDTRLASDAVSSDSEDVAGLERAMQAFADAWASGDVAALGELLSATYTHNDVFGTHLLRSEWLAYAAQRTGRNTGIAFRDVTVRMFGGMAVVTGFNDITGNGARNMADTRELSILFLQVWRWHNGRWLREAFQATQVVAEVAG
jgi:ketosteroid isomerase-like protein